MYGRKVLHSLLSSYSFVKTKLYNGCLKKAAHRTIQELLVHYKANVFSFFLFLREQLGLELSDVIQLTHLFLFSISISPQGWKKNVTYHGCLDTLLLFSLAEISLYCS